MTVSDGVEPARTFGDRWRGFRDALLTSRRFAQLAAAFPLTRPIARRRAGALFQLCAGFVYSQVLAATVRLRLFAHLRDGPLAAATLAARTSVPIDGMRALLEAAAALRLLERRGHDRYGLGPLGAAVLGNAGIAAMVEHHAALYADLADPVALLRGDRHDRQLAQYWPYAAEGNPARLARDSVSTYSALMAASQPMVADMLLGAYPLAQHKCLLDVGGGDGSFLVEAARRVPRLAFQLFELPGVAAIARERFAAEGITDRVAVAEGNFLTDRLPRGADAISLIRVIHDHDDDAVLGLLGRVRDALSADGVLLICEPLARSAGHDPVGAYFEIYLQAMGSGRPRSVAALQSLLRRAGFREVRLRRTSIPLIASLLVARP